MITTGVLQVGDEGFSKPHVVMKRSKCRIAAHAQQSADARAACRSLTRAASMIVVDREPVSSWVRTAADCTYPVLRGQHGIVSFPAHAMCFSKPPGEFCLSDFRHTIALPVVAACALAGRLVDHAPATGADRPVLIRPWTVLRPDSHVTAQQRIPDAVNRCVHVPRSDGVHRQAFVDVEGSNVGILLRRKSPFVSHALSITHFFGNALIPVKRRSS
jgi:hypothetical protein